MSSTESASAHARRSHGTPDGRPVLTGSATWLGLMTGTPVAGEDRGDRLAGTAALSHDPGAGTLDAAFGGIVNVDRRAAHPVGTVLFENVAVAPDGTFGRGQAGARIQGGFFGPGHAEAAGVFERSGMVGAFGARRRQAPGDGAPEACGGGDPDGAQLIRPVRRFAARAALRWPFRGISHRIHIRFHELHTHITRQGGYIARRSG